LWGKKRGKEIKSARVLCVASGPLISERFDNLTAPTEERPAKNGKKDRRKSSFLSRGDRLRVQSGPQKIAWSANTIKRGGGTWEGGTATTSNASRKKGGRVKKENKGESQPKPFAGQRTHELINGTKYKRKEEA